ncbi:MAG: hypothetical protein V1495_08050 [Pseudomonadota bacterium]
MKKILLLLLLVPTLAQAEFYVRPRAGMAIPLHGDSSYALGLTGGYRWTDFLSTEISYSRLLGTGAAPDGDMVQGEGIVSLPLLPVVTPFVSGGVGALHTSAAGASSWHSMILIGGGLALEKLLFVQISGGVTYAAVRHGESFFEPYIGVGLAF